MKTNSGITKDCPVISLTSIAAKIYNALLLSSIELEIKKIFKKNQKFFGETDPQHHIFKQFWRFLKGIWLHTQREVGANTSILWFPQRKCHSYKDESKSLLTGW